MTKAAVLRLLHCLSLVVLASNCFQIMSMAIYGSVDGGDISPHVTALFEVLLHGVELLFPDIDSDGT